MAGDSFFEKVTTRVDRERVYNLLVEQKLSILAVDEKKKSIKFMPKYLTGHKMTMTALDDKQLPLEGLSIVSFGIGNEKYFIKVKLEEARGSDVYLDMQADLYKLQRRNSFRLNIPTGFTARIDIMLRDSQKVKERYELVDLSGGGFAIELPGGHEPQFKRGEILEGVLTAGPAFKSSVTAVVRHSRMVGSRGSGLCRVGCEFQDIRANIQNEIIKIVMDLHRDMFSKFKESL